jgi:hypothetical protein
MTHTSKVFECANCGHTINRAAGDPEPTACTQCDSGRFLVTIDVQDEIQQYDELSVTARNRTGDIVGERHEKTDLNTSASVAHDVGSPTSVFVTRETRVRKVEEEGAATKSLVNAYNSLHSTSYAVVDKPDEDSDYPDRILRSKAAAEGELIVQVRHLDDEIIGTLGRKSIFKGNRTSGDIKDRIIAAVDDKALVDPLTKARTILLLILPTPLGTVNQENLQQHQFDFRGFKDIWIAPFHEKSFPLNK